MTTIRDVRAGSGEASPFPQPRAVKPQRVTPSMNPTARSAGASVPPAHEPDADRPPVALGPAAAPAREGLIEFAALGPFGLERGVTLPALTVAYRHDGPGPDAPQALVVHALTGSADAAGDWWEPLIGPGRAFDTSSVGVTSANLLGGRYGTTGPTSRDPVTGRPYGAGFPDVTVRDQARALWALLDFLGIERLALVTGGSLGGMVSLEVALERPASVATVVPVASPASTGPLALAWNHLQLELIDRLGDDGLDLARRLAMTTYRSEADFDQRFGRQASPEGEFAVTSYLAHQGRKLLDRFDVDTYRTLVRAMDTHDIGRGRGGPSAALAGLASAGTRLVGVGIEGDILYGPEQVRSLVGAAAGAGVETSYREVQSTKGHDAFLVEWEQLSAILGRELAAATGLGPGRRPD